MRILRIAIVLTWWLLAGNAISDTYANEYKLVMSEEKDVCQLMLKLANDGLLQVEGLENVSGVEKLGTSFVKWAEVKRAPSFQEHNGNVEEALFDINNDGQLDWIVRIQWAIGGIYNHELLTYEKQSGPLFQDAGFALQDENRADFRLTLRGQPYLLKKIPKHKSKTGERYPYTIASPPYLIPFQFNHTTYILVANPFELPELLPGGRRFAAVVKYPASSQIQDVCYLEEVR
jgi:hypothetical protein